MFCIKSDVITLESIEMYGFVTVWTSKDDGLYWVILFIYGSHDMRHIFSQVDSSQRDPRDLECHRFGLIVIGFLAGLSLFFQIRYGFGTGSGIVTPTPPQLYFKNNFLLLYFIL